MVKIDNLPKNESDILEPPVVKKQPEPRKSILSIFGLGDFSPSRKPAETTSSTLESTNNSSSQSVGSKTKTLENNSTGGPKLLSIKFASVRYVNQFSTQ